MRALAAAEAAKARARELDAERRGLVGEVDALSAEVGARIKVAEQREHHGQRTAFTFNTMLRDLCVRQCTLNAGARHVREVTAVYSAMIAADGRELKLESGSLSTVLSWYTPPPKPHTCTGPAPLFRPACPLSGRPVPPTLAYAP